MFRSKSEGNRNHGIHDAQTGFAASATANQKADNFVSFVVVLLLL